MPSISFVWMVWSLALARLCYQAASTTHHQPAVLAISSTQSLPEGWSTHLQTETCHYTELSCCRVSQSVQAIQWQESEVPEELVEENSSSFELFSKLVPSNFSTPLDSTCLDDVSPVPSNDSCLANHSSSFRGLLKCLSSNHSKGFKLNFPVNFDQSLSKTNSTPKTVQMIAGRWRNQLQSEVEFHVDNGHLTGTYWTQVSSNGQPLPGKVLHGTYQVTPQNDVLVGWSVQWEVPMVDGTIRYSTTSWSGLLRDGRLETNWILTSANEPVWKRTNIGHDNFNPI